MINPEKKLLTEREVAEALAVSRQTVSNWRFKGRGPRYLKVGRLVRYRPGDVEEFLKKYLIEVRNDFAE
jgi:excisionase family DNA binding protein